jgi:hypothetical protein
VQVVLLQLLLVYSVVESEVCELNSKDSMETLKILQDLMDDALPILLSTIEDHRSKVSAISKRENFYLNFSTEKISEYEYFSLCLMLGAYSRSGSYFPEDSLEHYLLSELHREVEGISERFKATKYFKLFYFILDTPLEVRLARSNFFSPREWYGNLEKCFQLNKALRAFSVRTLTPRRIKRKEFRRGYRDHGSMSSESERARRAANSVKSEEDIFKAIHHNLHYHTPEPTSLTRILSEARENQTCAVLPPGTTTPDPVKEEVSDSFKERRRQTLRKYRKENLTDFLRDHPEDSEPFLG